jgi:hypothetical protein
LLRHSPPYENHQQQVNNNLFPAVYSLISS